MAQEISASTFKNQAKREGSFRCELCDTKWPLSHRRYQDGHYVCKLRCFRAMGKEDIQKANAAAQREAASAGNQYEKTPVISTFKDVVLCRTVAPAVAVDVPLGGSATCTVEGYNLDQATFSAATGITITKDASSTSSLVTLHIAAGAGMARGDYDLRADTQKFPVRRNYIRVR